MLTLVFNSKFTIFATGNFCYLNCSHIKIWEIQLKLHMHDGISKLQRERNQREISLHYCLAFQHCCSNWVILMYVKDFQALFLKSISHTFSNSPWSNVESFVWFFLYLYIRVRTLKNRAQTGYHGQQNEHF